METPAAPAIFESACNLAALDRRHPDTQSHVRLLIDTINGVDLAPDAVKSLDIDPPSNTGVVMTLGKALNYLTNGPKQEAELAGWMTAGVVATIIAAAQESTTGVAATPQERLELQHALTTFAGLRLVYME